MSQQSPGGDGARRGGADGSAASRYAQPPYAQAAYPQQGAVQPYGSAPRYAPPGAYPVAPPREKSKALAITTLSIAIPAAVLRFLPFVGMIFIPIVIITMILAIVAISTKAPGKGMSITALIFSIVGLIVPFVLTALSLGAFLTVLIEGSSSFG